MLKSLFTRIVIVERQFSVTVNAAQDWALRVHVRRPHVQRLKRVRIETAANRELLKIDFNSLYFNSLWENAFKLWQILFLYCFKLQITLT